MPRYLETNFLDLGLLMTIQISVQKVHRGRQCTHAVLTNSVSDAWNKSLLVEMFKNLHGRLLVLLVFAVEDKESN